jgi:nucleotide-binding universal stress UspA family protein
MRFSGPVVCGVDFSDHSRRALVIAQTVAQRLNQPLAVVTAIDPLLSRAAGFQTGGRRFLDHAQHDLQEFVVTTLGTDAKTGREVTAHAVVGEPAESLLEHASSAGASMIVVGTEGLGRAQRLLFGSTTLRLMRATAHPILAVAPVAADAGSSASEAPVAIGKILCGVDFSAASVAAARAAHALGRALGVPTTLVHAQVLVALPTSWDAILQPREEDLLSESRAKLTELGSQLGDPAPRIEVQTGRPEDVIAAHAAGNDALVVLGLGDASGHRPGSTAIRIIANAHLAVLAVPADT